MSDALLIALVALASNVLGGGAVWGFFRWRGEVRVAAEEREIVRLRADVRELAGKHEACEVALDELRKRLAVVEHHHASHLARWIRDSRKRLRWVNSKAYLTIFAPCCALAPDELIGKGFAEILDPAAALEIDRLDRAALAHPGTAVSGMIQLHPDLPLMQIVKVATAGRDGELIYEGYAFNVNARDLVEAMGAERQADQRAASAARMLGGE